MAKKKKKVHGPNTNHWKKKADTIFSVWVRLRDGKCLVCGRPPTPTSLGLPVKGLETHHIINRTRLAYRYSPDNSLAFVIAVIAGATRSVRMAI